MLCEDCGREYEGICAYCADFAETTVEAIPVIRPSGRLQPPPRKRGTGVSALIEEPLRLALEALPRFEIEELRDTSSNGAWFRARGLEDGKVVNLHLKRVPPLLDDGAKRTFFAGLRQRADVSHEHLATTVEIGQVEDYIYLVEACPAGTMLEELLRLRPAKERRYRLRVLLKAMRAADAFHQAGLPTHKLDARRMLVGKDGEIVLLDQAFPLPFELPEDVDPNVTPAVPSADVWRAAEIRAAGELMFRILSGEKHDPMQPRPALPGVPRGLALACERALSDNPRRQWPSLKAFADGLERELRQRSGRSSLLPWVLAASAICLGLLLYEVAFGGDPEPDPGPGSGDTVALPQPPPPPPTPPPAPVVEEWMALVPEPLGPVEIGGDSARLVFDRAIRGQNFRLAQALLDQGLVKGSPELYRTAEQTWFEVQVAEVMALQLNADFVAAREAWSEILHSVATRHLVERAARGLLSVEFEALARDAFDSAASLLKLGRIDPAWQHLRMVETRYDQTVFFAAHLEAIVELRTALLAREREDHMVHVPQGGFLRGAMPDAAPVRTVVLAEFWVDRHEVTWERYKFFAEWFLKTDDHRFCHPDEPPGKDHVPDELGTYLDVPEHPVVKIDFWDAWAYAGYWAKKLPTEAQWEKAARGTDGRIFPWGNEWSNFAGQSRETLGATENEGRLDNLRESGQLIITPGSWPEGASPFGALDMAGNVEEWCRDAYSPTGYIDAGLLDPFVPGQENAARVTRGGSFRSWQSEQRTHERGFRPPDTRTDALGFRCVFP